MYVFENTGKNEIFHLGLSLCKHGKIFSSQLTGIYRFLNVTGDFVRQSGVEVGDSIHLYEDESKNLVSSTLFYSLDSKFCYR